MVCLLRYRLADVRKDVAFQFLVPAMWRMVLNWRPTFLDDFILLPRPFLILQPRAERSFIASLWVIGDPFISFKNSLSYCVIPSPFSIAERLSVNREPRVLPYSQMTIRLNLSNCFLAMAFCLTCQCAMPSCLCWFGRFLAV